jgi:hypothetical protein
MLKNFQQLVLELKISKKTLWFFPIPLIPSVFSQGRVP